jgi:hypothetical protein
LATPSWYALVLLSLGAFRLVRFVGYDDLTARFRAWVTIPDAYYDGWIQWQHEAEEAGQSLTEHVETQTQSPVHVPSGFRWWLARLIRCPWCAGAYVSVLVWLAWLWWPTGTVEVMTPLAIMALVGLIAKNLDP